jgi:hypothetical protein
MKNAQVLSGFLMKFYISVTNGEVANRKLSDIFSIFTSEEFKSTLMKTLFTYAILVFLVLTIKAQPTFVGIYPNYLSHAGACSSQLEGNQFNQCIVYGDSLDSLVIIKFSGSISGNYQNLGDFNFTSSIGTSIQRGQGIQTPSVSRFTMNDNWLLSPKSEDLLYINFYYGHFIPVPDSIQVTIDSVWYINKSTGDTFQVTTDAKSPIIIIRSCPVICNYPWCLYSEPGYGCYGKRVIHWETEYTVATYLQLVEKNILYGPFAPNDSVEINVDTSHVPGILYHY